MPEMTEGALTFDFPAGWEVGKPDDWSFYVNRFQSLCGGGTKAVDILAVEPAAACAWLVEVKDYRRHTRRKAQHVADEVALKVRDTLALLAAARIKADGEERRAATLALSCGALRVVLHLEQPVKPSRLFPRLIDRANVQQRLRQQVRAIDPHALAVESADLGSCRWSVR